jgi:hypothetical protein
MELLTPLRLLVRRWPIVALGALLAGAVGVALSGYVAIGPFGSPVGYVAIATADIQIDTPRPLAADLRASTATIAEQSMMLGERLAADDARALIARRAGVSPDHLAILSRRTEIVGRAGPVARGAVEAASSTTSAFRLTVSSTSDAPIISVVAAAPDEAVAGRLAAATAPAAEMVIEAAPDTVKKRLEVKLLGSPVTTVVTFGGPRPLLGVIASLLFFVAWCWCLVVAGGVLRVLRVVRVKPFAGAGRENAVL